VSLPKSILGDPQSMLALQNFMVGELKDTLEAPLTSGRVLDFAKDAGVDIFATIAANGVAYLLKAKYPQLTDHSWQVSTAKLWVKFGMTDAWVAYKSGGNPYAVVAATGAVAVGEIYSSIMQTIPVVADQYAGYVAQQTGINKLLARADAEQRSNPAAAQRLRNQAASYQQALSWQKNNVGIFYTLNPFN
jgi:hypothetical protein